MAMMQAISRANMELPFRTPSMYYMSVTAHGVLMGLVFTTFFIMGLGWAIAQKEIGAVPWRRAGWIAFWRSSVESWAISKRTGAQRVPSRSPKMPRSSRGRRQGHGR